MQVSVESGEGLERHLKVAVPAERIEQEVERRLQSLARRANISGFRPGKAPLRVVSQKYGGQVRGEVIGELMRSTLEEAMRQENLKPVSGPKIEAKAQAAGEDLEYIATFEVYPSVDLVSLEGFVVEHPVAEITEVDVDAMMGRLQEQRARWVPVDRPAQAGDLVTFDYEGTVEGREQRVRAKAATAVLGSGSLLSDLDQALAGGRPGDHLTASLKFPDAYPVEEVAGRAGQFTVTVTAVEARELPEIDEDFARGFGVKEGGVEALRNEVAANMRRELDQAVKGRVKDQIMDLLLKAHPIELPLSLVTQEIQRLRAQLSGGDSENLKALPDSTIEATARRRVALGLIILELAKRHGIEASADRVRAVVDGLASTYEEPDAVARWLYGDRRQLAEVESLVIEDQVVDWVLQRVRVNEVQTDFDTVVRGRSRQPTSGQ